MKPIYRYDIEQNTDEWFAEKVKRIGASSAPDLLMNKSTVGYNNLKDRLIEEWITGERTENKFKGNSYTERGHQYEPIAADDYEITHLKTVDLIGCVILDDWVMCSPDRLIDSDGLLQIKCPIFKTQNKYLDIVNDNKNLSHNEILKKIDGGYYKQCNYELYVTQRRYNVFYSFHPNLKSVDLTIERDEPLIKEIETRISELKAEVLEEISSIKRSKI